MAILNLSQYYSDPPEGEDLLSKSLNQNQPQNNNVNPMTTQSREPLLMGMDKKFSNSNAESPTAVKSEGPSTGSAIASSAGAALSFGSDVYQASQTTSASDKQADNKTMKLAASGMAMGATVGSVVPVIGTAIGAAAGAVIGATAGMLMKVPDRKKRLAKANEDYQGRLFDEMNQRNTLAEDYRRQEELQNQMDLKKAQMGMLNLKY